MQNVLTPASPSIPAVWREPCWLPQHFETVEQFQAFETFRQLPAHNRDLHAVARYCCTDPETVLSWADVFHWKRRVQAFDAHQYQDSDRLLHRQVDAARVEHMRLLEKAREVIDREFTKLLERQRELDHQGAHVPLLKPAELTTLLKELVKLDRLVMGEVTERPGSEFDLSKLTTEELQLFHELCTKAAVQQLAS